MANLKTTTIDGTITYNEGTDSIAAAIVALPQKNSPVVFEATNTVTYASSAYDISTNKYVVAYRDDTDGGKGKAIVGTPSGDSVVWGSPVQFSTGETTATAGTNTATIGFAVEYDPDTERILIAWSEGDQGVASGKGTSKVGTVSGTGASGTITFGSEGIFDTAGALTGGWPGSFSQAMIYDTVHDKMVITWNTRDPAIPIGSTAVGTIVGGGTNSITWGTPVVVEPVVAGVGGTNGEYNYASIGFDPSSQNIIIAWEGQHINSTPYPDRASFIRVGTVSGSGASGTITFGTRIKHMEQDADHSAIGYDPVAQKIILTYADYGAAVHGWDAVAGVARVGTVSGSGASATCHLGYPALYSELGRAKGQAVVYNANQQKHLIHYTYYYPSTHVYYRYLICKSATVTSATLSCTRTNASTTVTTADTSSLAVGMSISGTGMGVGGLYTQVTTIASITDSTTFVLSTAASSGGTSSLSFTSISYSGESIIDTSGYGYHTMLNMKISYNSADYKMLLTRPSPNPCGIIIDFNGTGLTVDLATGSFFEVDLETATEEVAELIISNPHASQVSTFKLQITQGSSARVCRLDSIENIKWPGGTTPTITTTDNAVDIYSFTTWDAGTTWYGKVVGQNFPEIEFATNTDILFGARGVWAGGSHDSGNETRIDYITIATPGNATTFGDLTAGHNRNVAGTSNGSRGVFPGQFGSVTTIDYITIATTGNATDFGDLTQGRSLISATSDGARGVFAGGTTGDNPTQIVNTIDYITIATTGNATDFGDLISTGVQGAGSATDGSRGLFAAGQRNGSYPLSIDYITIVTPANAADFGDMLETRRLLSGASDGSRGVFGGGGYMGGSNWSQELEYVTISTRSNSILFGNLTHTTVNQVAATSNGPRGVWGGGYVTNVIAYITIATTGDALDFGDLTIARSGSGATSGD